MFFKSPFEKVKERKLDEQFLTIVAEELENNNKHKASWAKAISDSNGNMGKAQSLYIKYRVQSLKDDFYLQQGMDAKSDNQEEDFSKKDVDLEHRLPPYSANSSKRPKIHPLIFFLIFSIVIIMLFKSIVTV